MSHDGLPVRAQGAREADADRPAIRHRRHITRFAAFGALATLAFVGCSPTATGSGAVAGATGTPAASIATQSTEPSAAASPSTAASTQATLTFQEANTSGIFGGGLITDLGDGSSAVTLGVVAIGFTDPMPAEIVAGDCATIVAQPAPSVAASPSGSPVASGGAASPDAGASAGASGAAPSASAGPSVAPTPATLPVQLTDVAAGSSNTVVQMPLSQLLGSPSAVVLHRSAADATVVACADVTNTPLPSVALPSDLPSVALPSDLPSIPPLPSSS